MSDTDILAAAVLEIVSAVRDYLPFDVTPPEVSDRVLVRFGSSQEKLIDRVIAAIDNPTINPVIARLEGRSDA